MMKKGPLSLLCGVLLFTGQVLAKEEHNLAVNQVNNMMSDKRIALVIGNSAYTNSPLKNPVNDAKDMANKLRSLGFDVIERNDLKANQIGSTLQEFRSKLVPGAVALVFYAGHGLQIKGDNYLPAVDAEIDSEEDVPHQSLAVKQIMDVLDESKTRLNLVFLDACRNNPYARSFRSADKGLARISAPSSGTLISYATKPGSVAADGGGRNGLYTSKLLAQMDSNLQIEQALKRVVTEVKAASQGKQEPWMEGSIEGDFCFGGCAASGGTQVSSLVPAPTPSRIKSREEIEQDAWESVRDSGNISSIQEYLKQYPKGQYVGLARILLTTLKTASTKPVGPIASPAREDVEGALWTEVQKGNSSDDYDAYLTQYPKGKYIAFAKLRIKKLQEEASRREHDTWEAADKTGNEDGYKGYLKGWPAGQYAELAQVRLLKLQADLAARQELELWQQAQAGENAQAVQAYLDKYPSGSYVAAARETLAVRQEQELWQQVEPSEIAQTVQTYLDKYPNGSYVSAALEKLAAIDAQQGQEFWRKAQEARADEKGKTLQTYLDKYPKGLHVAAALEKLGKMVNVGSFGAKEPNEKEITCWGFKVKAPDGESFTEFVRKSLLNELKIANVYYAKATVILTGNLDVIKFSFDHGEWSLALTVMSSNGKSLSISESYPYTMSSTSKTACDQTTQAFMPAVQNLVGKVVRSPEFPALVAKNRADEAAEQGRLKQETSAREAAQQEQTVWESAKRTSTEAGYQGYLNSYPQGHYVHLAAARIAKFKKKTVQVVPAPEIVPQIKASKVAQDHKTGEIFRDCAECPDMVVIPAGSFDMGSNDGDSEEKPVHSVTFRQVFAMGKTEVTQGQWRAVMGNNPSSFNECGDNCPVEQVGWNDAHEFILRLNQKTGKQYRLPTDAEWEYACRAGAQQKYCGSDNADSVAWYDNNSGMTANPVGRKQANAFGLYDMSGNVWEWVEDSWHNNYNGAPMDGSAWQGNGEERVLRGGSWYIKPQAVRAASRNRHEPAYRGSGSGFRLARMLP